MDKLKKLFDIIKDEDRKNILQILIESIHAGFIEREIPYFYFYNLLHKKISGDYKNFVGMRKRKNILNNYYTTHNVNLRNKITFNQILTSNNINTPKIIAYSEKNKVKFNNELLYINDRTDLIVFLEKAINLSKTDSIFIKLSDGAGGSNAFKLNKYDLETDIIDKILNLMYNNSFIFQETIEQHESINYIYDNSINTLRVYSYFDKDNNDIEIVSAIMRFGANGSVVDNGSSGNMFVSIDINNNWHLDGYAYTYLENGGESYQAHPNTNVVFDGLPLPYQKEIIDSIKKAAKHFSNEYIGWDIAITPNGPTIVEGNDRPHVVMTQIACGGFKNHPTFNKIFGENIL